MRRAIRDSALWYPRWLQVPLRPSAPLPLCLIRSSSISVGLWLALALASSLCALHGRSLSTRLMQRAWLRLDVCLWDGILLLQTRGSHSQKCI